MMNIEDTDLIKKAVFNPFKYILNTKYYFVVIKKEKQLYKYI